MTAVKTSEQKEFFKKKQQARSNSLLKSAGWTSFISMWWWEFKSSPVTAEMLYNKLIKGKDKLLPFYGKKEYQISMLGVSLSNMENIPTDNKKIYKLPNSKREYCLISDYNNYFKYTFKDDSDVAGRIPMLLKSDTWRVFVLFWSHLFGTKRVNIETVKTKLKKFEELNNEMLLPFYESENISFQQYFDMLLEKNNNGVGLSGCSTDVLEDDVSWKITKVKNRYKLIDTALDICGDSLDDLEDISSLFGESMSNIPNASLPQKNSIKAQSSSMTIYRIDKEYYSFLNEITQEDFITLGSSVSDVLLTMIYILLGNNEEWKKLQRQYSDTALTIEICTFINKKYINQDWVGDNVNGIVIKPHNINLPTIFLVKNKIKKLEKPT